MNRRLGAARRLLGALTTLGVTAGLLLSGAPAASATPCTGPTVAAISDADDNSQADVVAKLRATCLFTQVDQISLWDGTPSLGTLTGYDAVLVYSGSGFPNNVAIGDVLADYVDGGGRVVVGALAFWNSDHPLGMSGRLSSGGYLPFTQSSQAGGSYLQLQADLPNSPYLANVASFNGGEYSLHNAVGLATGATLIAHWSTGTPLVAVKRRVVGLNFYPPSSDAWSPFWDASTDGDILMADALLGGGVITPRYQAQVTVGAGLESQTRTIAPGHQATFTFTVTNLGNVRDTFTTLGGSDAGLVIKYFSGRTNVTAAVLAGTYVTTRRAPGRAVKILLEVHVSPDDVIGTTYEIAFVATSVGDTAVSDGAFAEITV
jgi:hypothetical protein